jgi:hypothetical protein
MVNADEELKAAKAAKAAIDALLTTHAKQRFWQGSARLGKARLGMLRY